MISLGAQLFSQSGTLIAASNCSDTRKSLREAQYQMTATREARERSHNKRE